MLPILLLGGAALFLMTRGGDEDGGVPDDPIDKDVEALSNVKVWSTSDDTLNIVMMGPFPRILVATTGWSLEEVSVRMKSTIEANPEINFLFAPIYVLVQAIEEVQGEPYTGPIEPNSTLLITDITVTEGMTSVVDELNWDTFDAELKVAVEYIKSSPALLYNDRNRQFALSAGEVAVAPTVAAGEAAFLSRLQGFFK